MINKHGLKMQGLKAAAGESKYCRGPYGLIGFLYYYPDTGRAALYLRGARFAGFLDGAGIFCGRLDSPATMQAIADLIAERIEHLQRAGLLLYT